MMPMIRPAWACSRPLQRPGWASISLTTRLPVRHAKGAITIGTRHTKSPMSDTRPSTIAVVAEGCGGAIGPGCA